MPHGLKVVVLKWMFNMLIEISKLCIKACESLKPYTLYILYIRCLEWEYFTNKETVFHVSILIDKNKHHFNEPLILPYLLSFSSDRRQYAKPYRFQLSDLNYTNGCCLWEENVPLFASVTSLSVFQILYAYPSKLFTNLTLFPLKVSSQYSRSLYLHSFVVFLVKRVYTA